MKTFCRPVKSGWKPMPSSSSAATRPATRISPQVGWVVPAIIFSRVLLPAPLTPTMPTASPGSMVNSTSRRIQCRWWRRGLKGTSHSNNRLQRLGYCL